MKYRKKPIEVEAVQLNWANWNEIVGFVGPLIINPATPAWNITEDEASDTCGEPGPEYIAFKVKTVHGEWAIVRHGDWVIPDSRPGTFYPCKPDVFAATYEPVEP